MQYGLLNVEGVALKSDEGQAVADLFGSVPGAVFTDKDLIPVGAGELGVGIEAYAQGCHMGAEGLGGRHKGKGRCLGIGHLIGKDRPGKPFGKANHRGTQGYGENTKHRSEPPPRSHHGQRQDDSTEKPASFHPSTPPLRALALGNPPSINLAARPAALCSSVQAQ